MVREWLTLCYREHLYRNHALPKYSCPRCFEDLKDDAKLKKHQRSEKSCKVRTEDVPDGFDQELEARLRARAKSKSAEEDKWVAMFEILFPGASVPNPCMTPPRSRICNTRC